MKAATDFFLDISIDFIIATLEKVADGHFSLQLSLILNTHSKKGSKVNNDIINLLSVMSFPVSGKNSIRKSSNKMI